MNALVTKKEIELALADRFGDVFERHDRHHFEILPTGVEEICAIVDCDDTFDLASAAHAGVDLKRTLWVRCGHSLERAFKAVDLILHAGGFGLIVLNLCNVPAKTLRRVISSWWFRFRRAIEDTPTALIV